MKKGYFFIISAAVLWGTMGVFVKVLASLGFSTLQIAQLRSIIALVLIFLFLVLSDRNALKINLSDIWMFIGTGVISYFIFNLCYFTSLQSVGMSIASILLYTAPVFVTVMSWLIFKERMNFLKIFSLILAVLGCALVSGIGSQSIENLPKFGIIMGVLSGFTYALYSIFSVFALRKYNSLTITFYSFLFASIFSFFLKSPIETISLVSSGSSLFIVLLLGIITGAAPYFLYTKGLSSIEPSRASILASIEPVVASLIGIIIFKEDLSVLSAIGIVLVLTATALINLPRKDGNKKLF